MRRRGQHILPHGHAANAGDFRIHLGRRQNAAMGRFRALAELHLDHLHDVLARIFAEFVGIEIAVRRAAAEITGADLPDNVAAAREMIRAEAPFPGIMGEVAAPRARVQGMNGGGGQRAETHGRDIEAGGLIGLCALRSADDKPHLVRRHMPRGQGMAGPLIAHLLDIPLGTEGLAVHGLAGALIDHVALLTIIGTAAFIGFDEILVDFRADKFQRIAHMADDRIIAQHIMPREIHVIEAEQDIGHQQPQQIDHGRPEKLHQKDKQQPADGNAEENVARHDDPLPPLA